MVLYSSLVLSLGFKGSLLTYEYVADDRKLGAGPPCVMDMTIISPAIQNALADNATTESTGDPLVKYFLSTISIISEDKIK
jgi:hypothetical protein